MSLSVEEIARVEAEAGALTADPVKIAAAVAGMEAIAAAGEAEGASAEARYILALWRYQGSEIEQIEPGLRFTQAEPYEGV